MSVTLTAFENPTIVISIERKRFLEFFPVLERDLVLANANNIKFPTEEVVLRERFANLTCKKLL